MQTFHYNTVYSDYHITSSTYLVRVDDDDDDTQGKRLDNVNCAPLNDIN